MTAIVQERYADRLVSAFMLGEAAVPAPGRGEVLVRVDAAGVDRGVWHLATGKPYAIRLASGFSRPRSHVPGLDVAGTVAAVGEGVAELAVGDAVFGTGAGTYAEYAIAKAGMLARRPAGLDAATAAALPVSGCTAKQAVADVARVVPGERVLVIGASGGVGSFAVQLAVAAGADVTGVASGAKRDFVLALGARDVIDYRTEEIDARGGRYDVVLDIAGNRPLAVLRRALAPRGRLVIVGGEEGGPLTGGLDRQLRAQLLAPFVGQRMGGMFGRTNRTDLAALAAAVGEGSLRPAVTRTYRLAEAGAALDDLAAGRVSGKAVILVDEG
ncbi:NAD(P)-dependent alcohol dehydrogenase [Sinomonas sp. P47F7]|uniref:NAD(P)-dependent alcohol dehydrogenase n=1 Tax=Sinomonas sp. P47F7 TaxID=3410987 RepID=UPI003BF5D9CB